MDPPISSSTTLRSSAISTSDYAKPLLNATFCPVEKTVAPKHGDGKDLKEKWTRANVRHVLNIFFLLLLVGATLAFWIPARKRPFHGKGFVTLIQRTNPKTFTFVMTVIGTALSAVTLWPVYSSLSTTVWQRYLKSGISMRSLEFCAKLSTASWLQNASGSRQRWLFTIIYATVVGTMTGAYTTLITPVMLSIPGIFTGSEPDYSSDAFQRWYQDTGHSVLNNCSITASGDRLLTPCPEIYATQSILDAGAVAVFFGSADNVFNTHWARFDGINFARKLPPLDMLDTGTNTTYFHGTTNGVNMVQPSWTLDYSAKGNVSDLTNVDQTFLDNSFPNETTIVTWLQGIYAGVVCTNVTSSNITRTRGQQIPLMYLDDPENPVYIQQLQLGPNLNANIAEAHQEVISTEDFIAAFAYSPNPGSNKVVLEIQPFGKYAKVGEDKIDPYQRANLSTTIPNTTCTIDPMLALWKARGFYASAIGLSSPIDDGEGPIDQLSANSSLVAGNLTQFFQNLIRVTSSQTTNLLIDTLIYSGGDSFWTEWDYTADFDYANMQFFIAGLVTQWASYIREVLSYHLVDNPDTQRYLEGNIFFTGLGYSGDASTIATILGIQCFLLLVLIITFIIGASSGTKRVPGGVFSIVDPHRITTIIASAARGGREGELMDVDQEEAIEPSRRLLKTRLRLRDGRLTTEKRRTSDEEY